MTAIEFEPSSTSASSLVIIALYALSTLVRVRVRVRVRDRVRDRVRVSVRVRVRRAP